MNDDNKARRHGLVVSLLNFVMTRRYDAYEDERNRLGGRVGSTSMMDG